MYCTSIGSVLSAGRTRVFNMNNEYVIPQVVLLRSLFMFDTIGWVLTFTWRDLKEEWRTAWGGDLIDYYSGKLLVDFLLSVSVCTYCFYLKREGVKVYIQLYKELTLAVELGSEFTVNTLNHPNIVVSACCGTMGRLTNGILGVAASWTLFHWCVSMVTSREASRYWSNTGICGWHWSSIWTLGHKWS